MSQEDLIRVNVWIAGRSYPIRIKPEEEEAVRKAVKIADQKIMEMRSHYSGKDDQDFIAMCLLTYAADSAIEHIHNPLLKNELSAMIKRIDEAIK